MVLGTQECRANACVVKCVGEFTSRWWTFKDAVVSDLNEILFSFLLCCFVWRGTTQARHASTRAVVSRVVEQRTFLARVSFKERGGTSGLLLFDV